MKKKRKLGRKLLSFLLTLVMIIGLMPGMSLTAQAAETSVTWSEPFEINIYDGDSTTKEGVKLTWIQRQSLGAL